MRTPDDVAADLARLGVAPGRAVMVHASLRRIGPVAGGAAGVVAALDKAVGPDGGLLMVMGSADGPEPFDPLTSPVDPDVGRLAEAFRTARGTIVTDNPEGRFGARGGLAGALLQDAPWDDYFGPGSPLARLVALDGAVLRLGADPDTVTLMHYAEYLAPVPDKRRVVRERWVAAPGGPVRRTVACLDDSDGIVAWDGEDYFKLILDAYLATGAGARGRVGDAASELLDARDLVDFSVRWMADNLVRAS
ncbi:MAG: AAC(3) family N-acetyltransferase [Phenylobacterium sp.]|uniref:aminoglycoside N(3)-acetyltransferase n=1 Tax=Phenylobacterium sp. TaxID=1871053 RepID=UPI001A5B9CE2|nr:AAC(3) family N-acetyltransferase [Phenylobacterium sp.]MBL8772766.1 AAC(3) family N-acetyltransferase [Phenylobacterium sp.]